nr:MAG TPA: SMODS and SLOG-associating 2TM effector domain family 4 [Caudoviricetes sp.]
MATLLLIICIAITVVGILLMNEWDYDLLGYILLILGLVSAIFFGITVVANMDEVASGKVINQKISMYQTENRNIEEQVDTLVKEYMEHEDNTFENARSKDTMTLVSLYPELKSDSLVKEQISVYNKNNAQIKKLKEKKIDVSIAKWWLYFGK